MKAKGETTPVKKGSKKSAMAEINRALSKGDPIVRKVSKEEGMQEHSPMDPPNAYDPYQNLDGLELENMSALTRHFYDEHVALTEQIAAFEAGLLEFKEGHYRLSQDLNRRFSTFFEFVDSHLLPHNQKEEKVLFPLLRKRLLESGEHSQGLLQITAIDLFEDDHVKFIQLAALTFNFLGLGPRLPDPHSSALVMDIAYNNGVELVELLKLHIFREDHTLFPLAEKLLSKAELNRLAKKL